MDLACQNCGRQLRIPAEDAGKVAQCPACGGEFVVPPPPADMSDVRLASSQALGATAVHESAGSTSESRPSARELPPLGQYPLVVGDVVGTAWRIFQANAGMLIALAVIALAMHSLGVFIQSMLYEMDGAVFLVGHIFSWAWEVWITAGWLLVSLRAARGQSVAISDLFQGGFAVPALLIGGIIYFFVVGIGFLFLIVPGVILLLMFSQYSMLVVDRQTSLIDSLFDSRHLTDGNLLALLGLLMLWLLMLLGAGLTCGVGLIVVIPLGHLLQAVAYLKMSGQHVVDPEGAPLA